MGNSVDGDDVSNQAPPRLPMRVERSVVADGVSSTGDGVARVGDGVLLPERNDPAARVGVLLEEDAGSDVGDRVMKAGDGVY